MTTTLSRVPISAVVMTLNEERNIRDCLESVHWADEIVVVDSSSQDRTVEIAREYTDQIIEVTLSGKGDLGKKRNWTMQNVPFKHEWILLLDADDRIPDELAAEIAEVVPSTRVGGFLISQRYVFMNRPLAHCRGPLYQLKLFKHRLYRCDEEIHEYPILDGRVGYLKNYYLQMSVRTFTEWIERHNYYSTREAQHYLELRQGPLDFSIRRFLSADAVNRKKMLKRVWVRLPLRPVLLFLVLYIVRRGFLDGREGLIFSLLRGAGYEFLINLKLSELP